MRGNFKDPRVEGGEGRTEVVGPTLPPPTPARSPDLFCSRRVLCFALCGEMVGEGLEKGWREGQERGKEVESGG